MASIYGAARRTFVPSYKRRRRQRERAAFVQSIRLHGGDGSAVSAHDGSQCAGGITPTPVSKARGVGTATAQKGGQA